MPLDLILKPRTAPDVTLPTFNQLKTMEEVIVKGKVKPKQPAPQPKEKDNFFLWAAAALVVIFVIYKMNK